MMIKFDITRAYHFIEVVNSQIIQFGSSEGSMRELKEKYSGFESLDWTRFAWFSWVDEDGNLVHYKF